MGRTSDARERLIATAIELIRARSYESVGVDALCNHAQVKKGSFYHFFPSKQDLMLAALDRYWDIMQERIFDRAFLPELPPLQRIEQVFRLVAQSQADTQRVKGQVTGCAIGNLAAELSTQCPEIREKLASFFERMALYFQGALREAAARGEWAGDPQVTAQSLVAFLYGSIMLAKTGNDAALLERLFLQVRVMVLGAAA
jgi:TetR/AcrR family transcriptional repressor of nem operon